MTPATPSETQTRETASDELLIQEYWGETNKPKLIKPETYVKVLIGLRRSVIMLGMADIVWIVIQNVAVGVFWSQESHFSYPAWYLIILTSIMPIFQIVGASSFMRPFLLIALVFSLLSTLLGVLSLLVTLITSTKMDTLHNACISNGMPSEECMLYDGSVMNSFLLEQSLMTLVLVIVKFFCTAYGLRLYLWISNQNSPLREIIEKYATNDQKFDLKAIISSLAVKEKVSE